ncbi:hypothetical protein [Bradyrhizobium guangdongense]
MQEDHLPSRDVAELHHLDVSPGHLHALGAISVNFNLLESAFYFVVERFAPSSTVDYFFWDLNNARRISMLKHFSQSNADEDIAKRIDAASSYFQTCYENRNLLMHSRIGRVSSSELLSLATIKKRDDLLFDVPLTTLQRIADEMWVCVEFFVSITEYIERFRQALDGLISQVPGAGPKFAEAVRTLPPIPPPPLRLDPKQKVLKVGAER